MGDGSAGDGSPGTQPDDDPIIIRAAEPDDLGVLTGFGGVTARPSVAYLAILFVRPDQRARGVGTRLVAAVHRALDERDIAVTLLHHSLPNPYSTPFWARQGYRPLWTAWQRRPAWLTSPE